MVGTDQENATAHPDCDRAASLPLAAHDPTMDHGIQTAVAWPARLDYGHPGIRLIPTQAKASTRVTLLVGMTHQRAECRVNLRAEVRVSPSGTPPGPYAAYTCPSPGATDWS